MKDGGVRWIPDFASLGGLVLGLAGIVGGLLLEGGKLSDISQVTAAVIVLGGTAGAVMITTPTSQLLLALRMLRLVFFEPRRSAPQTVDELIMLANKARRGGIMSLEADLPRVADPFLRKALRMSVDGTDIASVRQQMQVQLEQEEDRGTQAAKVFEAAGGYAPTVGIIGAVLGLIQVMKHLDRIDQVGHGIAVAFVATVYGVGFANLFLLPAAGKIRARTKEAAVFREMLLEGACSITQGLHPKMIYSKLSCWNPDGLTDETAAPTSVREAA